MQPLQLIQLIIAFCSLVAVDDWTIAVLGLHISDRASPVAGATFTLELLPPPLNTGPEFLVLQQQFENAVKRQWRIGDRVWVSVICHGWTLGIILCTADKYDSSSNVIY